MSVQQFPRRIGRPGGICLTILLVLPTPIAPAVITVDGGCTLVDAITAANDDAATGFCPAGSGADEIRLTGDVTLTAPYNYKKGLPPVTSEITIQGYGFKIERSTDPETPEFGLFDVWDYAILELVDLTVANGVFHGGGGIISGGTVSLTNSTVSGNTASILYMSSDVMKGGGIANFGTLDLTDSTVSGNVAEGFDGSVGGGIYNGGGATLTLTSSTVSGNTAEHGGGIHNGGIYGTSGTVTLVNSTVSGNQASELVCPPGDVCYTGYRNGGGIHNDSGTVTLTNSLVAGNRAKKGGGIWNEGSGTLTINDSTLSSNAALQAGSGGGIYASAGTVALVSSTVSGNTADEDGGGILASGGTIALTNSTISGNAAEDQGGSIYAVTGTVTLTNSLLSRGTPENCSGPITNAGNNLADDASCGTIPDTLTGLEAALLDNGGPTMTHALRAGSNARDAGSEADCPATDQRGAGRVSICDIGAFEFFPCPDLVLDNEIVSETQTRENCQAIVVGPDFSVASSGDLTLRAGKTITLGDTTSIEPDGQLAVEVVPDLQFGCEGEGIDISYYYSYPPVSGTATVLPGSVFTIWNAGGDIAECRSDCLRQVRAFNHDYLSGDGPGTLGPWVSEGCSTAEEFGYVVECCVL